MNKKLKKCPFCGGEATIAISDDEGNMRDEEYEKEPWSGLSYTIEHLETDNNGCPIASHDGEIVGILLYKSRKELVKAWNNRKS